MTNDTSAYRTHAREVFVKFRKAMENPNDGSVTIEDSFWRFGCCFDTMTDYLFLIKDSKDAADLALYNEYKESLAHVRSNSKDWAIRVDPYAQYLKTMIQFGHACCYDDFSWWGIASCKALPQSPYYDMMLDLYGESGVRDFQKIAQYTWGVVNEGDYDNFLKSLPGEYPFPVDFKKKFSDRKHNHGGSRLVWDRVTKDLPKGVKARYDGARSLEPRYTGGMWQYDYYWDPIEETYSFQKGAYHESCAQSGDPQETTFRIGPFQNTLMSNLAIIYASRLHNWGTDKDHPEYLPIAKEVTDFVSNWLTLKGVSGDTSDDQLLWNYVDDPEDDKVLVRERVGTYKKGKVPGYWVSDQHSGTNPDRPTNRVWTGDQGLLIGSLVDYGLATGSSQSNNELLTNLVQGTLDTKGPLFYPGNATSGGELQPCYPWENWGSITSLFCLRDYWSGAAVFWRYLLQTYKTNEGVKSAVKNVLKEENNAIIQSADFALTDPVLPRGKKVGVDNVKPLVEEVGALFMWFGPMATLIAAIYILEDQSEVD